MRRWRWVLVFVIGLMLGLSVVPLREFFHARMGKVYRIDNRQHREELQRKADNCAPLIALLEKGEQASAATAIGEFSKANPGIVVTRDQGGGFSVYLKLNWDASLQYRSDSGEWVYDSGLGEGMVLLVAGE